MSRYYVSLVPLSASVADRRGARRLNPDARAGADCWYVPISRAPLSVDELQTGSHRDGGFRHQAQAVEVEGMSRHSTRWGALGSQERVIRERRAVGEYVLNPSAVAAHQVYVLQLDDAARSAPGAAKTNPDADPLKACFYVGMTARDPEERLHQHLRGYRASRMAKRFGLSVVASSELNPHAERLLNELDALRTERRHADRLRRDGYWVFGGH